eukprot:SAG25_NODE_10_length_28450_cov_12.738775_12_plen_114_part_00
MITWFVDWQKQRAEAAQLEAAQLQAQAQALGGALPTPVWTSLLSPSSAAPHLRFPRRHQILHLQQSVGYFAKCTIVGATSGINIGCDCSGSGGGGGEVCASSFTSSPTCFAGR